MKRRLTLAIGCLAFAVPAFSTNLPNLSRNAGLGSLKTHKQQQTNNNINNMAKVNVRPLGDRVLVQQLDEAEVKKGGIIIPDTAKENRRRAKSSPSAPASVMMTGN